VTRAFIIGLALALTAGCHHDKEAEGPAERAGESVDRAAQKTGTALHKAAVKTDEAARKAVHATGEAFEKAGKKLQGNSGASQPAQEKK
jgi:hypothetical protein